MAKNIQDALNNVEMGYSQLIEIGNDMLADLFDPINNRIILPINIPKIVSKK